MQSQIEEGDAEDRLPETPCPCGNAGYNPMLEDFSNTSFFLGSSDPHIGQPDPFLNGLSPSSARYSSSSGPSWYRF